MTHYAETSEGVHAWRVAKTMGLSPGEVLTRAAHKDPEVMFAFAAEAEDERRKNDRWESLAKLIKNGFEALSG